jgi:hypothetical protein
MKYVKVVSGTYGWADPGTGRRTPKTPNDAPFQETDVKAARFVKTGILAYADGGAPPAPPPTGEKPYGPDTKFNDLKKIAIEALGLAPPAVGTKKDALLAQMDAKWAELNGGGDDDNDDNDDNDDGGDGDGGPLPPLLVGLEPKG